MFNPFAKSSRRKISIKEDAGTCPPKKTPDPLTSFKGIKKVHADHEIDVDGVASIKQALSSIKTVSPPLNGTVDTRDKQDKAQESLKSLNLPPETVSRVLDDGITHVLYLGNHELDRAFQILRYSTIVGNKECYICPQCLAALSWKYEVQADRSVSQTFTCRPCAKDMVSPVFLSEFATLGFEGVYSPEGLRLGDSLADCAATAGAMIELNYVNQQLSLVEE